MRPLAWHAANHGAVTRGQRFDHFELMPSRTSSGPRSHVTLMTVPAATPTTAPAIVIYPHGRDAYRRNSRAGQGRARGQTGTIVRAARAQAFED